MLSLVLTVLTCLNTMFGTALAPQAVKYSDHTNGLVES